MGLLPSPDAPIQRVREVNKITFEVCGPSYASFRDIRDSSHFGADNVNLNAEVGVYHAARIFYRLKKLAVQFSTLFAWFFQERFFFRVSVKSVW